MTTRSESEIFSAIAAFEKILEAAPTDRLAIETLADAYQKLGDIPKASHYLVQLANAIITENDAQAAAAAIERMRAFSREDVVLARTQLQDLLTREGVAPTAVHTPAPAEPAAASSVRKAADITHEVALAWELLQAGRFTQTDYSLVVQDLSENSMKHVGVPVTVLHALTDRQHHGLEKILAHLSKISNTPIIPLASFELNREACAVLPMDFMARRGAIVFDFYGSDALVATLNPTDKDLQADVKRVLKRNCHFYLVSATDYDNALANIRKMLGVTDGK